MTPEPWLRPTVAMDRLEADLRGRGWGVWWARGGALRLTSPEGHVIELEERTTARTMRAGYEAARDHTHSVRRAS